MSVYIKDMDMPTDCLACRIACDKENYGVIGRPPKCPLAEAPVGDLISRADALRELNGVCSNWEDDAKVAEIINALPSAEVISHEEHVKELNDLAVEWRAKFAKAEKITDEIYDETMAKVAKECEECKERLRNIRPSAEATGDLISRQWLLDLYATPKDGDDVYWKVPLEVVRQNILDAPSAEAVQGEWKHKPSKSGEWIWWQCSVCGAVIYSESEADRKIHHAYCGVCGARMYKGGDSE